MRTRLAAMLLATTVLYACGGSDDGSLSPNRAPSFTSSGSVSVAENASGAVYTATANDPDDDTLTYSIASGTDAALFAISADGAVTFRAPPDFDAPQDADRDNIYQLTLQVSDGAAASSLALSIRVTDSTAGAFSVRRVASGLNQPVFLTGRPGSNQVFVVELPGRIRLLDPATGTSNLFMDISSQVSTGGERGLLGFTPAPDFATSGVFYVYLTNPGGAVELRRYRTVSGNPAQGDAATGDILLTFPHPRDNHNGGWISFGPDGLLYVATGDGGGGGDPDNNGQNNATLLGKMLRLDITSDAFPGDPLRDYAIPATNPFATGGGAAEVWLKGLRNPFRNSFDRATGDLWIADVGQNAIEEINLLTTSDAGINLGWPLFEGTQVFRPGSIAAGLTPPVAEYGHGSGPTQGSSITGGYVYRGPVEALQGLYFFADFVSGNIWTIQAANAMRGTTLASSAFTRRNDQLAPDAGTISQITSFGEDGAGNLYIVTIGGSIFRIEAR